MAKGNDIEVADGAVYVLRAGSPVYLKTADICTMTGKTNQWIGQLTAQGVLHKRTTPYGSLYEMAETMRDYCDMLSDRADASEETQKMERARRAAEVTLKSAKAKIAKLEADELSGKMHRAEDIEAINEDFIYTMRSDLLALPGRVAVDAAAAETPAEVAEIVRKEVYAIMRELANYHYDPKKYVERARDRHSLGVEEEPYDE